MQGGSAAERAVWFANDLPQLGDRPNGGFHLWRAGSASQRLLRSWWHLPGGQYNEVHDYEQHSLQWSLTQLSEAIPLFGTLQAARARVDPARRAPHAICARAELTRQF
eukprot:6715683-Prymnesium_polylepis.1